MIDQVPREIALASLDKARRIRTPLATFAVRHIPPELFDGWTIRDGVRLALPGKALFDTAYVSAVHLGRARHVPELELPRHFRASELDRWVQRIRTARLRTLTQRAIDALLSRASR